jgi:hypothetical protein
MRNPEHDTIQIVATADQADKIEEFIGPNFTLMQMPTEMQSTNPEDDLPIYFLALTDEGAMRIKSF